MHEPRFPMRIRSASRASAGLAALVLAGFAQAPRALGAELELEQIMADPDWIGAPVQDAYWGADGRSVYYSIKRAGSPLVDLHRVDLKDGKDLAVAHDAMANADGPPILDAAGKRAAFVRNGDVFVRELASKRLTQATRGAHQPGSLQFSADGAHLSFREGNDWFVYEIATRLVSPAALVKAEKDPDAAAAGDLAEMQLRTFSTLRKLRDDKELRRKDEEAARHADPTLAPLPFYLGDDVAILDTQLSPDGHWMLVVTAAKAADKGRKGKLTRYVTDSGYEEFEDERVRVGRNPPPTQSLVLLDLENHAVHALALESLPGIHDDPLKAIREENAKPGDGSIAAGGAAGAGKTRGIVVVQEGDEGGRFSNIAWSRDARALAIEMFSIDNKDRWIASVRFHEFFAGAAAPAQRSRVGRREIRRNRLAQRQPNPVVSVGGIRLLASVREDAGRRGPGAHRGPLRGLESRAFGRWALVLSAQQLRGTLRVGRVPGRERRRETRAHHALARRQRVRAGARRRLAADYAFLELHPAADRGRARRRSRHAARTYRHANRRLQGDRLDRTADRGGSLDAFRRRHLRQGLRGRRRPAHRAAAPASCSCTARGIRRTCICASPTISASRCSTTCSCSRATS